MSEAPERAQMEHRDRTLRDAITKLHSENNELALRVATLEAQNEVLLKLNEKLVEALKRSGK